MASPKAERSSHLGLYEDDFDEDEDEETRALVKAAEDSVQMGSIAPLLKAELKAKIQLRRLQSGQEELVLQASQPTFQMTIEEIQKRNLKREKNRLSALRTRVKQKVHETELLQKIKRLEETHQRLTTERERLQQKVLHKRQRLARHLQDCPLACRDSQHSQLQDCQLTCRDSQHSQLQDCQLTCRDSQHSQLQDCQLTCRDSQHSQLQDCQLTCRDSQHSQLQDCPLACRDSQFSQLRVLSPAVMSACGSDSAVSVEVALGSDSNTSVDEAAVDVPVSSCLGVAVQMERKEQPDDSHAT